MTLALLAIACEQPSTDDTPGTPPSRVACEAPLETGEVCTVAGDGHQGLQNDEFTASEIWLNQPSAVSFDPQGRVILTDFNNMRILRLLETGEFEALVGTGFHAYAGPDGILGVKSPLENPIDAVMAPDGTLYVAELHGTRVLKIGTDGILTTYAGNGVSPGYVGYSGDGGPANEAELGEPTALALDDVGNLYFSDSDNDCIRVVSPDGIIDTLAGTNEPGWADGIGTEARFDEPHGLWWHAGVLYVADRYNNAIRGIDTDTREVTTIAGLGPELPGFSGDGGPAVDAQLYEPMGLSVGADDSVYVADSTNDVVRVITPDGLVQTLFGEPTVHGFQDGALPDVLLSWPNDVGVSPTGDLWIVDTFNQRLRVAPGLAALPLPPGSSN
jgi:trimeric autotransporter adhesin